MLRPLVGFKRTSWFAGHGVARSGNNLAVGPLAHDPALGGIADELVLEQDVQLEVVGNTRDRHLEPSARFTMHDRQCLVVEHIQHRGQETALTSVFLEETYEQRRPVVQEVACLLGAAKHGQDHGLGPPDVLPRSRDILRAASVLVQRLP